MLIQGTVPDTDGLGEESKQFLEGEKFCGAIGQPVCFGSNAPVQSFFRGANTTQYGGKSSISPEAAIDSPDWYAPLTGSSVDIAGLARARFATGGQFHWKLMWGVGEAPSSWTTAHEGESSGTVTDFGSIDLGIVRKALETFVVP